MGLSVTRGRRRVAGRLLRAFTGRRVEAVGLAQSAARACLRRWSDPEIARCLRLRERR